MHRILRGLRFAGLGAVVITALSVCAQQVAPPVVPTAPESEFAGQLAAMPPAEALKSIAAADAARMTEGLYRALRAIGDKASDQDPSKGVQITQVAEAVASRAGMRILASDSRFMEASYMSKGGDAYGSIPIFDQALAMYKDAGAPTKSLVIVYIGRAVANLHLGDLDAAIQDDTTALSLSREDGDEVAVARAENGLGNAYLAQSRFSEAEAAFSDALRIARAKNQTLGEAFVLNNLSMVYSVQGDYPLATRFCEESMKIKRKAGNKPSLLTSLINLANFYHMDNRDADANRALNELADLGRELKNDQAVAKATAEKGIIELDHNRFEPALKLLLEGMKIGTTSEDMAGQAMTLHKIGEAYLGLNDYPNALKYGKDAEVIDRRANLQDQLSDAELVQGEAYMGMGRLDEARAALTESVNAIERIRGNVTGGSTERQLFMQHRIDPYRMLAAVNAAQHEWAGVLDASEKGKGRMLLDLYTSGELSGSISLTAEEHAEERRLRNRVHSLDMQIDLEAGKPGLDPAATNTLNANLKDANAALSRFREDLYKQHPELRLRRADLSAVATDDLQMLIPNRAQVLLEYELTTRGNYLLAIARDAAGVVKIHGYKLAATNAQLARHARQYREQLATRDPDFATEARWLYTTLFAPAERELKNATSLVIVPDGVLWQVPFQALQRTDGRFIVENAAVAYIPSLAVLRALKATNPANSAQRSLLALGNPDSQTPEQSDEVIALKKLYGGNSAHTYLGPQATLVQFKKSAPDYDVIHVAAHGIFDDRDPMASHMLLAATGAGTRTGWLRAQEIELMQLRAGLIVLSGCETGKGEFEQGEGLVGMSWAALAAGARTTVASAWRVEASSTAEMMISFHRGLLSGTSKAESLRKAELSLLHSQSHSHPFYWAPFVLMGDGAN
ncbi:MAG: CHAT domain-containing protein [Terracidiphilus sp.]